MHVSLQVENCLYLGYVLVIALGNVEGGVRRHELAALGIGEELGVVEAVLVDLVHSLLINPLQPLTLLPDALLGLALFGVLELADAVLLALVPPALVLAPVCPVVMAVASFLVFEELAFVAHAITIDVDTVARHIVVFPLAIVLAAILPDILAHAIDLVVVPVA